MAIIGSNFIVIEHTWTEFKAILASKSLPLQSDTVGSKRELFALDGPVVYRTNLYTGKVPQGPITQAQNDTDLAEFVADYEPSENGVLQRRAADGSVVTKSDPGTSTDDPHLYAQQFSQEDASEQVYSFEIAGNTPTTDLTGKALFGVRVQIKGAEIGDTIGVRIVSDGNYPNPAPPPDFLPEDTLLQTFGEANAPQNGGGFIPWEIRFGTAKSLPSNAKLQFCYDAVTAAKRDILVDWMMQE